MQLNVRVRDRFRFKEIEYLLLRENLTLQDIYLLKFQPNE